MWKCEKILADKETSHFTSHLLPKRKLKANRPRCPELRMCWRILWPSVWREVPWQKGLEGFYSQEMTRCQDLKTRLQWFGGSFFSKSKTGLVSLKWDSLHGRCESLVGVWVWSGDFRKWTGLGFFRVTGNARKYLREQPESFTVHSGGSKKTGENAKEATGCHRSSHPSDLSCKVGAGGNRKQEIMREHFKMVWV